MIIQWKWNQLLKTKITIILAFANQNILRKTALNCIHSMKFCNAFKNCMINFLTNSYVKIIMYYILFWNIADSERFLKGFPPIYFVEEIFNFDPVTNNCRKIWKINLLTWLILQKCYRFTYINAIVLSLTKIVAIGIWL